jgi:hypothetical protein
MLCSVSHWPDAVARRRRAAARRAGKDAGFLALKELPAFPLKAHVESVDIVSGKYPAAQLLDAGRDLFHTPFNGLDGVGVAVGPGGMKVNRFVPIGPTGPAAQT